MQTVTVEGYLAADPTFLTAQGSGKRRAQFRILETTRFSRNDSESGGRTRGERTTGFNAVCFSENVVRNYLEPHARKGSRVIAIGHVENDTWEGQDGAMHYDLRLVVDEIRLKNKREAANDSSPPEEEPQTATRGRGRGRGRKAQQQAPAEDFGGFGYDEDSEIPF